MAGSLSLADAARVVAVRAGALAEISGRGGVLSVALGEDELARHLRRFDGRLSIAAVNGPRSIAVAGDTDALEELEAACRGEEVRVRRLPVTIAAHSAHVESVREVLLHGLAGVEPRAGEIPFYSAVTGGVLPGTSLDAEYWYRNLREPVRFDRAVAALLGEGRRGFVEISPHPVLGVGVSEAAEQLRAGAHRAAGTAEHDGDAPSPICVLGSLRRGEGGAARWLRALGEAWICGVDVDWTAVLGGGRTVALPGYPFRRRRFWFDAFGDGRGVGRGHVETGHRLIAAGLELAEDGGWVFTGSVSMLDQPWVEDHVVAGLVIVPGATFVDAALWIGGLVGCEVLEDLVHEAPLVLSRERPVAQLQVTIGAPDEDGRRSIAVCSRCEDVDDPGAVSGWVRNGRGIIAPADPDEDCELPAEALAGGSWPPAGAEPVPVDEVYDWLAGVGLDYGPAFTGIRAAWRRGAEVFTELRLPEPESERVAGFGVHPALLDAVLQSSVVFMRENWPAELEFGVMPFAWTRARMHGRGASILRVRVREAGGGGYSFIACDEHGRLVFSADSLAFASLPAEALAQLRGVGSDSLFEVRFEPAGGGSLEIGASSEREATWAVLDGFGHAQAVPADRVLGFDELAALPGDRQPRFVFAGFDGGGAGIDGGGAGIDGGGAGTAGERLLAAIRDVLLRGLGLLQECSGEDRLSGSKLVLLTRRAVCAVAGESVEDLSAAPLWGLVRSAQSEHPGRFVLVDVDEHELSLDALAGVLAAGGEQQLAVRGGEILAGRLRRVELSGDAPRERAESTGGVAAEHGAGAWQGSVLITGGTGAIGSAVARHLVREHGARSLMLLSRRGSEADGAAELEAELSGLGADVRVLACDASDREQLSHALSLVPSERPLSAVLHVAGALDDALIGALDAERFEAVLPPKLDAAWHLHELTADMGLGAFVLFSSAAGVVGGPGQGNYAAANAFLDALAARRQASGLAGLSIAWGWWQSVDGMTRDLTDADEARIRRSGMLALSREQGLSLFDVASAQRRPLLMAARLNMEMLRAQARAGAMPAMLDGLVRVPASSEQQGSESLARRLAGVPERQRSRVVLDLVLAEVASVLGHSSVDQVEPDRAFKDLGFDSLAAVELRNRLARLSGVQLPATVVFDHPNAASLSDHLLAEISPALAEHGAAGELSERQLSQAIAEIPLARLRDAGVLDTLLRLAGLGLAETDDSGDERAGEDLIDQLDVESLVQMTLQQDAAATAGEAS
ncbi:MAG: type I polyketide synthase [Solirubrobacteraceae bacterium]